MTKTIKIENQNIIIFWLRFSTFAVFLGRGIQHIIWDVPIRTLLWDESWMKSIIEQFFQVSWETYSTSLSVDHAINITMIAVGCFYLFCALLALVLKKEPNPLSYFWIIGSIGLIFLAFLYCKEKFFSVGQFFEYSLQFSTPLFLYIFYKKNKFNSSIILLLKIAIALTFTCHGLYALGIYPRPGNFIDMTINILQVNEQQAIHFLNFAGIMDIIISIALFLPFKYARWAIFYAIVWGLATTAARIWANFYIEMPLESIYTWWHESVYRIPHAVLPLVLWIVLKR